MLPCTHSSSKTHIFPCQHNIARCAVGRNCSLLNSNMILTSSSVVFRVVQVLPQHDNVHLRHSAPSSRYLTIDQDIGSLPIGRHHAVPGDLVQYNLNPWVLPDSITPDFFVEPPRMRAEGASSFQSQSHCKLLESIRRPRQRCHRGSTKSSSVLLHPLAGYGEWV